MAARAGGLLDERTRTLLGERHGADFEWRLPVVGVDFHDAAAYCKWKTRATGREWRLPTEEEREKAARGVDGRTFAWGDLADPSLGKCRDSRPEGVCPEPVGAFATAASAYGMGDASGNVYEWTDSWFDEQRVQRVLRGGGRGHAVHMLRCTLRSSDGPKARYSLVGFRCARSLPRPLA